MEAKRRAGKGRVDGETLLNGMLQPERLLDQVEHFILFDDSKPGGTRKIIARNHQVLGVNSAVASVVRQEVLKKQFPPDKRAVSYTFPRPRPQIAADGDGPKKQALTTADRPAELLPLIKRAHPGLGRLGCSGIRREAASPTPWPFLLKKSAAQYQAISPFWS